MVLDPLVENGDVLQGNQVHHRNFIGNDLLEGEELLLAFGIIDLDGCGFKQLVHLRVGIVAGVGEGQAELEILRPVDALYAERRIELVAEILGRYVEGAVGVDLLDVGGEVVGFDRGVDADTRQVLLQIFGNPLEPFIVGIVGETQVEANAVRAALVAGLVEQLFGGFQIESIRLDRGVQVARQKGADRRGRNVTVAIPDSVQDDVEVDRVGDGATNADILQILVVEVEYQLRLVTLGLVAA
jgi:hypothetical protein